MIHVPYRTILGETVYLQNEVLDRGLNVNANNVLVGSNIVNERPQGPITVENGKSTIRSKDGVTIYNDFEVKLGATLEIVTD